MIATLPSGLRLYAVGDIHGRADLLDALLARITRDVRARPAERVRLVFLGDYVDRGPDSHAVIDRLCEPLPEGWERVCLRGNHEDMMTAALADPREADLWLINGGIETLGSYFEAAGEAMPGDTRTAIAAMSRILPAGHSAFLRDLHDMHRCGGYLFVHAGVRPGVPLEAQNATDLHWIRGPFLRSDADFGCVVVHGHTITHVPEERPNRIGIDTGAFASDILTALVLEGPTRRFLQTNQRGFS